MSLTPIQALALFVFALVLIALSQVPRLPSVRLAVTPAREQFMEKLSRRLRVAGFSLDRAPSFVVGGILGVSGVIVLVSLLVMRSPIIAVIGAAVPPVVFYLLLLRRERQFRIHATRELITFLEGFASSVAAQVPPATAYQQQVARSRVLREPDVLGDSAARMAAGESFIDALTTTLDKLPLRMWRMFVSQLQLNAQYGGNLLNGIEATVTQINTMLSLQAEAAADAAGQRFQQTLIFGIAIAGVVFFSILMGWDTMKGLFTTVFGVVGLIIGVGMIAHGFWYSMKQLRDIDERMNF